MASLIERIKNSRTTKNLPRPGSQEGSNYKNKNIILFYFV